MHDIVWISTAMSGSALVMPVRNEIEDNPAGKPIDSGRRNDSGDPLAAENFPASIWATGDFRDSRVLPDLFYAYTTWVVSAAVAEVLRQFDLGAGGLYPVEVFRRDRVTRMGGSWFCLNFGNVKHAFQGGAASPTAMSAGPSGTRWRLPYARSRTMTSQSAAPRSRARTCGSIPRSPRRSSSATPSRVP